MNPLDPAFLTSLMAQAADAGGDAEQQGASLLTYITGGGLIGWIIVALSVVAVCLVVIHSIQIRRTALLPPGQVVAIRDML
ncbi:MAG: hypothetical protein RLZZ461_1990, partial [Planctomycetota bacterium]